MYKSSDGFSLGLLDVSPILGRVQTGSKIEKLEPLIMDVLTFLAARPGETVLRDELLSEVWYGHDASDESLTRAISLLRKTLKILDPKTAYIETIPKRGYRLMPVVMRSQIEMALGSDTFTTQRAKGSTDSGANELVLQGRALNERPFHTDV